MLLHVGNLTGGAYLGKQDSFQALVSGVNIILLLQRVGWSAGGG